MPPLYHIRINISYNSGAYQNLDNLQFLAMFIQQVYFLCFNENGDSKQGEKIRDKLSKRLSVFLIPHHKEKKYQFAGDDLNADTSLYLLASQYLRLIAKMHNSVIFALESSSRVKAVEFTKHTKNKTFIPLLYLANTASIDNYRMIFEKAGMPKASIIEKSLTYKLHENDTRPFNNAGNENPQVAIADIILDETRARLLTSFGFLSDKSEKSNEITQNEILEYGREEISKYVKEISKHAEKYDRFTFALFGYLFTAKRNNENDIKKAIEETMRLAHELGYGIRQIVQNAIQHSQYHACYLSFSKVYCDEELLCVKVTDLNTNKTVVDTFIETLKAENKYENFRSINISLNQLISEFNSNDKEEILTAWYNYRKTDSSAHLGLTMFNNTLKRCNCKELSIISNTTHNLKNDNIYTDYFENDKDNILSPLPMYVIPGTQISFSIPVAPLVESSLVNLVQLANNNAFSENYAAFAHYLDFKISSDVWKEQKSNLDKELELLQKIQFTSAIEKIKVQDKWKFFWLRLIEMSSKIQKEIQFCNIINTPLAIYLKEMDNCEVFIKGFFAAASLQLKEDCSSYIYFENLPVHFIDVLQEVSIPLSLMDFSKNLQVFFSF
jgi:hypothetical protein